MEALPEGIILIDKPLGMSSFGVVQYVRKMLQEKKVGHAGTLDPLASGLMLVGVGKGTKELTKLVGLTKEYMAEICIGESSTTDDREGAVTAEKDAGDVPHERIRETLLGMVGTYVLPVPVYSAMKKGGEAFYKKARRGEHVIPPMREMEVLEAEYASSQTKDKRTYVTARFTVGSGTYIRSLAVELGKRLGYPARLENLRRTKVGEYRVVDAQRIA